MPGVLTEKEVDHLLNNEVVGRIGCCDNGRAYIVPINYACDGKYLYAHSKEGLKIDMMRRNKNVCFEIDCVEKNGSWKSVLVWGVYEEIKTVKEQRAAMRIFINKMVKLIPDDKARPSHGFPSGNKKDKDPFKSVVFRIVMTEKTGRFENK